MTGTLTTDVERIVWGGLAGITVYVIGQLLSKFFIEPLHELRKAAGEVRFNLAFHAPTIHTPIGRSEEISEAARQALMKSSCDLIAKLHAVPGFTIVRHLYFGALPNTRDVGAAAVQLRGFSTYVHEKSDKANENIEVINKRVAKIESLLRLKPLE
ncbi:hypothetical protein [Halomonas llamarensis]|uniref:Uncharacterized protein n=1 Tax=Halomonas llamarensis TaxID=2945104 RepID=A0ABT0SPG0_9GAMM|nr:hypothetical protein [Halomonas llamarensis]MCL7929703.1 hypothetical protein [Halomonas llamarensis]